MKNDQIRILLKNRIFGITEQSASSSHSDDIENEVKGSLHLTSYFLLIQLLYPLQLRRMHQVKQRQRVCYSFVQVHWRTILLGEWRRKIF